MVRGRKAKMNDWKTVWKRYTEDRMCECGCTIFLVNHDGNVIKCNDCKKEVKL